MEEERLTLNSENSTVIVLFPQGVGSLCEVRGLIKTKTSKVTTYTETYFQDEGKRAGRGSKVIRHTLEQKQTTLVPEAKSKEKTGQKRRQNCKDVTVHGIFLIQ